MLSFRKGRPIAIIKGGRDHNKILYLSEPESNEEKNEIMIKNDPSDMLDESFIRSHKKKMSIKEMRNLRNAMRYEQMPDEQELADIYSRLMKESSERSMKEFKIYDDGILQPLPNFNATERAYIAGPTGSGKSYYVCKYLEQLKKVFPDRTIYIFSDVKEDPVLDKLGDITRVNLDAEALERGPIAPEQLADSICVFDDIDSIQDKKMYAMVQALRDSLLRRGRHENISVIVTSHLMSNYKDTRIILNECNSITFFPRSGASDAIKYTLKKYGSMNKQQIEKALSLPSRWTTLNKHYPMFVLYEKGAYIL